MWLYAFLCKCLIYASKLVENKTCFSPVEEKFLLFFGCVLMGKWQIFNFCVLGLEFQTNVH